MAPHRARGLILESPGEVHTPDPGRFPLRRPGSGAARPPQPRVGSETSGEGVAIRDPKLTRIALELWADLERRTELPVQGYSMWPVLRSGERIVVRHGGAVPQIGQVIVILHGDRVLAHRVIQRRRQGREFVLRTKGDTCLGPDPGWADPGRIVGVVEGVMQGEVITRRTGLQGPWARFLAVLSRSLSILCSPFHALWIRQRSRKRPAGRSE